jgi:beta-lactamase regulating signal transducer with metallopeptidase domain
MTPFLHYHELHRIGWTLLHTLWQGAAVWAAAAILLRSTSQMSAQARYLIACGSMAAMVLLAICTYALLDGASFPAPKEAAAVLYAPAPTGSTGMGWLVSSIPWLSVGWMLGVIFFSIRLLGGWWWIFYGIKRGAAPAPSEWQWRADAISKLMGLGKKVRLMVSANVMVPLAVGWIKPAVLLPASALMSLSPEALEAIIVHELAHIRRHDFIVNFVQSIVEALFFYHPAAWWLSSQMRELREHCCDDAAVRLCGSSVSYASALVSLETLRADASVPPQPALAANGACLMKRIQRLLNVSAPPRAGIRAGFMAAALISALGASALWGLGADGDQLPQRQRISVRDENSSLDVLMKGQIKLDSLSKEGISLEDGAAIAIAESKNGSTRSLTMKRKGSEINKAYRVDGEEKPVDAEADAWIKMQVSEIQAVQAQKPKFGGQEDAEVRFNIAEGDGARIVAYSNRPGPRIGMMRLHGGKGCLLGEDELPSGIENIKEKLFAGNKDIDNPDEWLKNWEEGRRLVKGQREEWLKNREAGAKERKNLLGEQRDGWLKRRAAIIDAAKDLPKQLSMDNIEIFFDDMEDSSLGPEEMEKLREKLQSLKQNLDISLDLDKLLSGESRVRIFRDGQKGPGHRFSQKSQGRSKESLQKELEMLKERMRRLQEEIEKAK